MSALLKTLARMKRKIRGSSAVKRGRRVAPEDHLVDAELVEDEGHAAHESPSRRPGGWPGRRPQGWGGLTGRPCRPTPRSAAQPVSARRPGRVAGRSRNIPASIRATCGYPWKLRGPRHRGSRKRISVRRRSRPPTLRRALATIARPRSSRPGRRGSAPRPCSGWSGGPSCRARGGRRSRPRLAPGGRVEAGGRLVEEEQVGVADQGERRRRAAVAARRRGARTARRPCLSRRARSSRRLARGPR